MKRSVGWVVGLGILVTATMIIAPRAMATGAEGPGQRGTEFVTVTPSDNLTVGQTVLVSGTGFTPNTQLAFNECKAFIRGYSDCDPDTTQTDMATAGSHGSFPPTPYVLSKSTLHIPSINSDLVCGVNNCAIGVGDTAGTTSGAHHISFGGTGTTIAGNTLPPHTSSSNSSSSELPGAAIGGIVAGVVVVVGLAVFAFTRRRKTAS